VRTHARDDMQDYLFVRPMPAADYSRALAVDWRLPD
jgi:hypothetical protein